MEGKPWDDHWTIPGVLKSYVLLGKKRPTWGHETAMRSPGAGGGAMGGPARGGCGGPARGQGSVARP